MRILDWKIGPPMSLIMPIPLQMKITQLLSNQIILVIQTGTIKLPHILAISSGGSFVGVRY